MDQRSARSILTAAVILGSVAQALLFRTALGLNVFLLIAALLAGAIILRRPGARLDRLDAWMPATALAFAGFVAIHSDPFLVLMDVLAALGLAAAVVAALGGAALTRRSLPGLVLVALRGGALVLGGATEPIAAARPADGSDALRRRFGPVAPLLRGLLIAIPVLLVFAGLFAAADAVFSRALSDLLAIDLNLGELPARLGLAAVIAWVAAGLLVTVVREVFPPLPRSLGAAAVSPSMSFPRLGSTEAFVVLAAVDFLFAVFVAFQVTYLFGGRDTLAATGMTYSEYARRGFFELIGVAFLAGGLIAALEVVVAARSRAYLASAAALAGLALVVLASATLRMKLYQDAYGWTELRFYAYAAIVWLGLGAMATMALLATARMRWLGHVLGVLAIVVVLAVNAVGPQGFVAGQNLARVIDPTLVVPGGQAGLDVAYLASLGDDATPVMVQAVPYVSGLDRSLLEGEIRERAYALAEPAVTAWSAWNLARDRAREAIAAYLGR